MHIIKPLFVARPYQRPILRKFLVEHKDRMIIVAHRRFGKDTISFNMLWMRAIQRPGLYLHLLPKIGQASTVIWRGRGKSGSTFLDFIPKQLVKSINNSTMSITLVNGSIIKITGADNYEALIGSNPLGVVFSEMQSTDPDAWQFLRPILAENDGWAVFIGTPRGHNHFYEMFQKNENNPGWSTILLTADDTTYEDGTPVISKEMLEEELASGMPMPLYLQEYFCSWEAAIEGAYFSDEMIKCKESGRICRFDILPEQPVHTSWDIGVTDSTSIGLFQRFPDGSIRCIDHLEGTGKGADEWAVELLNAQRRLGFKRWGKHYLPHDVRVKEWGSGRTRIEILRKAGIVPRIVSNHRVMERIQAIRMLLKTTWFHADRCQKLVRSLQEYHSTYTHTDGASGKGSKPKPVHNWASHSVDQFGYFAMGHFESEDQHKFGLAKRYASFTP